eukprot:616415-Alexandrium_andersonii.AAC.1
MSASLVGSEMCIRDRRRSASHRQSRTVPGFPGRLQRCLASAASQTHLRCLLYTSDAADDM